MAVISLQRTVRALRWAKGGKETQAAFLFLSDKWSEFLRESVRWCGLTFFFFICRGVWQGICLSIFNAFWSFQLLNLFIRVLTNFSPRVWAYFRSFRRFWNVVHLFSKLYGWLFRDFLRLPIQLEFFLDSVEFSQIEIICCSEWLCIGWSCPVDLLSI